MSITLLRTAGLAVVLLSSVVVAASPVTETWAPFECPFGEGDATKYCSIHDKCVAAKSRKHAEPAPPAPRKR